MKRSIWSPEVRRGRGRLLFFGMVVVAVALVAGLWVTTGDRKKPGVSHPADSPAGAGRDVSKPGKADGGGSEARGEEVASGSHPSPQRIDGHRSPQSSAGTSRQPQQFRAKPVEPAAVLAVLASGKQTVNKRVRHLQGMRGISFSNEERESALAFLAGKEVPEGMGSIRWLADELFSALRLQSPPWDGLAAELGKVAFQPGTDPVVRDYIMRHLGHLWELYGAREEIEKALWKAVAASDETTPGTAPIALSRGYVRDHQDKPLADVRQQALALAANPNTTLAVRVTALSIAGDGGGKDVKDLAANLAKAPGTPVILRKVAERLVR